MKSKKVIFNKLEEKFSEILGDKDFIYRNTSVSKTYNGNSEPHFKVEYTNYSVSSHAYILESEFRKNNIFVNVEDETELMHEDLTILEKDLVENDSNIRRIMSDINEFLEKKLYEARGLAIKQEILSSLRDDYKNIYTYKNYRLDTNSEVKDWEITQPDEYNNPTDYTKSNNLYTCKIRVSEHYGKTKDRKDVEYTIKANIFGKLITIAKVESVKRIEEVEKYINNITKKLDKYFKQDNAISIDVLEKHITDFCGIHSLEEFKYLLEHCGYKVVEKL